MRTIFGLVALMLFGLASQTFALERFDIVTTAELEVLLENRHNGVTDFLLVNGLDEIIYRQNSIPGSINLPWSQVPEMAARLGSDKDKLIITY
jgi:hypothetical protein